MGDKSKSSTSIFMSSADTESAATTSTTNNILSLQLEKPLGLILEEASDASSNSGVIVTQVNEGGSAYKSPSASSLPNSKIVKVMDVDVSSMGFDDVMDVIVDAPSPLVVEFALPASASAAATTAASEDAVEDDATEIQEEEAPKYEVGTTVSINVEQPEGNKAPITLEAKVGDNLRKTLLSNKDIELYRGLKKKLGNCGGGGQCGYCAVELIDNGNGVWGERSEYEHMKIGKKAGTEGHRLACMNNIVGPATIKTL